jgi:hypothetical protein
MAGSAGLDSVPDAGVLAGNLRKDLSRPAALTETVLRFIVVILIIIVN